MAMGFDLIPQERFGEYGYGEVPDVIDGLAFERLNSASGPTTGEIRRPSDGKIPKEVVFIQCTGSRDPERYMPYCSRVCCMYTAKHARLYKHKVHDGRPTSSTWIFVRQEKGMKSSFSRGWRRRDSST